MKSAQMAGLSVNPAGFTGASKYLDATGVGSNKSQYAYQAGGQGSVPMTSVGLLCRQYLGAKRDNPMMVDGTKVLMGNLPDLQHQNIYYWYYATQVLHNMSGSEWDTWNRSMRKPPRR